MTDRKDFEELLNSVRLEDCFPDADKMEAMIEISDGSIARFVAYVAQYGFLMGRSERRYAA